MLFAVREDYEPELRVLERFLADGMVFVDGGANCGAYTVVAGRRVGRRGRVFSFEPGSESFSVLRRNIELNRLENVKAFRLALSDSRGNVRLYHHRGPNSYSLAPSGGPSRPYEVVAATTLDAVLADEGVDRLDFLKLDVEGAEELVLNGAGSLVSRFRPTVLFEIYRDAAARLELRETGAWDYLARLGYTFFSVESDGSLRSLAAPPPVGNVLAVPAERADKNGARGSGSGKVRP